MDPGFVLPLVYSGNLCYLFPSKLFYRNIERTGVSWEDKVSALREELPKQGVDAMVITALDEVAWLLNIRGNDVPNSPVISSYMYVSADQLVLFIEDSKVNTPEMTSHLNGVT